MKLNFNIETVYKPHGQMSGNGTTILPNKSILKNLLQFLQKFATIYHRDSWFTTKKGEQKFGDFFWHSLSPQ